MADNIRDVKTVYASDANEDFLLAEIEVDNLTCCQILKRREEGPVMVAFFRPDSREELLVYADDFLVAIRKAIEEIGRLKLPR